MEKEHNNSPKKSKPDSQVNPQKRESTVTSWINSPTHVPSSHSSNISLSYDYKTHSLISPRYRIRSSKHHHHHHHQEREKMSDWGPVLVTVILFVMLTPGLLFQLPGRQRYVEFGNFQTSAVSVIVHSLLYFSLVCVFLLALKIHIYIG